MIAYVDASVLLRVALRQPDALPEWRQIEQGVSNETIEQLRPRLPGLADVPDPARVTPRALFSLITVDTLCDIVERALPGPRGNAPSG